jgi:hypothetical protein
MNDLPPSPAERLARSREQLRHALAGAPATTDTRGEPGPRPAWWHELRALPAAGIVVDAVQQWWARHPLRATTLVAVDAAQAVVQPLARSHPLTLVAGAFVVGALLAWRRPWGWILKPALFAGLLPQLLVASLKAQAQQAPAPRRAE